MNSLSTNALIFNIGGGTVDIALIEMIDNKPTLIKSDTWYKGMLVLYSTIIESINKKFQLTLENLNYTVDDLLNLKRYHSLNLLSYEKGYWAGITKFPKPLK